jgi:hypothetical protein
VVCPHTMLLLLLQVVQQLNTIFMVASALKLAASFVWLYAQHPTWRSASFALTAAGVQGTHPCTTLGELVLAGRALTVHSGVLLALVSTFMAFILRSTLSENGHRPPAAWFR